MASKSHLNDETQAWINQWGPTELVQAGSSLKFCRIADGTADLYPRLAPTCEWDTAAAQAVLEGAGGHVFDLQGQRLRYGKEDVLNPSFIASRWSWEQHLKILNSKA
jgi:3'(2'), 5'-bisphosphate nucleotidase